MSKYINFVGAYPTYGGFNSFRRALGINALGQSTGGSETGDKSGIDTSAGPVMDAKGNPLIGAYGEKLYVWNDIGNVLWDVSADGQHVYYVAVGSDGVNHLYLVDGAIVGNGVIVNPDGTVVKNQTGGTLVTPNSKIVAMAAVRQSNESSIGLLTLLAVGLYFLLGSKK